VDVSPAQAVVGLVLAVRLVEFWISRRNAELRMAEGAEEIGGELHLAIAMFHAVWLAALAFLAEGAARLDPTWLAAAIALLALRGYRLSRGTPGWSLRLFKDRPPPGAEARLRRFMRDPCYVPMLAELLVVPLVFGLWWLSLAGTGLYAALAWRRLAVEGLR
jgi:methyltransferase